MKKKTSKQKGVLAASVLLAGAIVAGGTFAWFTSQDEVVNQLSASNNYGVAITETFTPPSDWIPGQEINKDVSAVNTGNVDAFVRMSISNTMDLTTLGSTTDLPDGDGNTTKHNYVTLSTTDTEETEAKTGTTTYTEDEVTSIQAGGVLAGAWSCSSSTWSAITSDNPIVGTKGTEFKPSTTGLYLFRRDLQDVADTTGRTFTYDGYYYVQNSSNSTSGVGTYYALASALTENSSTNSSLIDEYGYFTADAADTVPANVKYQTTEKNTVTPTLTYVKAKDSTPAYIKATYDPCDADVNKTHTDKTDDYHLITININLSQFADGLDSDDTWTYIASTNADKSVKPVFYYNELVAAGTTSDKLIDSVTLDSSVTADAYYSFDYNLSILLDSVQVTIDADGNQTTTALEAWKEVEAEPATEAASTERATTEGESVPTVIKSVEWETTTGGN